MEGQNLTIEYRVYGQHLDLLPQYAAELVKAQVDVIAAIGDEAVRAVEQATKTIPRNVPIMSGITVNSRR